ncbi:MAG: hypothetical protein FWF36_09410 [Propionibacteriaceae bacterium]|nr:hypothetical protein [Propionibacteriaceae bacterium]
MKRVRSVAAWLGSKPVAAVLAVWVVDSLICWMRVPPDMRGRLWAEDGLVFLRSWALDGSPGLFFQPYAGYLQFLPRAASSLIALAPIQYWAVLTAAAASICVGAVGAVAFHCSRSLVTFWPARIAVALVPALLPLAGVEPLGTLCNLHSWALYAAFWLLFTQTRKRWVTVLLVVFTLAQALSEIQIVFFAVLAAWFVWRSKNLGQRLIGAAVIVGSLAQVVAYLSMGRAPYSDQVPSLGNVIQGMLISVFGGTLTSSAALMTAVATYFGYRAMTVLALVSLVPVVLVLWRADGVHRLAVVYGGLLVVGIWFFSAYLLKFPGGVPLVPWRWGMGPAMLLLSLWIIAIDHFVRRRRLDASIAVFLLATLFIVQCVSFTMNNPRRQGNQSWSEFVVAAKVECAGGATQEPGPGFPADWSWMVPCELLR